MNAQSIVLKEVNLHYASAAYREQSLKSFLTKILTNKAKLPLPDVHALKNVTLTIGPGERVGLLGHNGAGKSTLLKVLAHLYPISSGYLQTQGTVRSLFDLSLGFEPDATGRENILYRGLLLGLSPYFMRQKQAEIIEFADLGAFIDYPIKTYSAGMQVRLAFAISTAVGGDILLLDEVIGAGDARFMHKAKLRIESLIAQAKILVLTSHDCAALETLCNRGIVLNKGEITFDGPIKEATYYYKQYYGTVV